MTATDGLASDAEWAIQAVTDTSGVLAHIVDHPELAGTINAEVYATQAHNPEEWRRLTASLDDLSEANGMVFARRWFGASRIEVWGYIDQVETDGTVAP